MKSCVEKCKLGDVILLDKDCYRVTGEYIHGWHPSNLVGPVGYVCVLNIRTGRDTFMTTSDMERISKIIKVK